jgi:hypothetical protein
VNRCVWPGPYGRCGQPVVDARSRHDLNRVDLCYYDDKRSAGLFELAMPPHPRRGIEPSQPAGVSDETRALVETLHCLGFTLEQARMALGMSQTRGGRR